MSLVIFNRTSTMRPAASETYQQPKLSKTDQRALEMFDAMPDSGMVSIRVLCTVLGLGQSTAWRWLQEGVKGFPEAVRDGPKCTRFKVGAIRAYLAKGAKAGK